MAVFDNLKNFIRQGKQAGLKKEQAKTRRGSVGSNSQSQKSHGLFSSIGSGSSKQDHNSASSPTHSTGSQVASTDNSGAGRQSKEKSKRRYDNAVKKIIEEENASRNKLPTFPGLEAYQLVEKMGDGAFSIVYRATEVATGDPRAIKIISKRNITPSQRASVLKEAAIMRQIDHPSIVHMYEFLDTPEYYYIVLELVSGGELFHQIVHLTYFSEDLSRHVIVQVAEAVRYLHEVAGVVHRDIKPENLLFTRGPYVPSKKKVLRPGDDESKEDEGEFQPGVGGGGVGTIKLADFGLSKVIWDSKTMTPCGTVGYTAPEIVKDEKYSKSVDMWALGCVLYTILCGFPPFYDESIEVLTHKVAMGQYAFLSPWWDGISDSAKDLVSQLLTVDPEKRYTIDDFLNHPWITQKPEQTLTASSEVRKHTLPSTPLHDPIEGTRAGADRSGALRDAFDVSNAVYRLEEEVNRRNLKQRHLAILEDEEGEVEDGEEAHTEFAHIEHAVDNMHIGKDSLPHSPNFSSNTNRPIEGSPHSYRTIHSANSSSAQVSPQLGSQRAAAKRAAASINKAGASVGALGAPSFFDLHLEGSTLLERRKARQTPVAH